MIMKKISFEKISISFEFFKGASWNKYIPFLIVRKKEKKNEGIILVNLSDEKNDHFCIVNGGEEYDIIDFHGSDFVKFINSIMDKGMCEFVTANKYFSVAELTEYGKAEFKSKNNIIIIRNNENELSDPEMSILFDRAGFPAIIY